MTGHLFDLWTNLVLNRSEDFADFGLDFVAEFLIVSEKLLDGFTALGEFGVAVAEPGAALLDDVILHAQIDYLSDVGNSLTEYYVELGLLERRSHLVLHDFDPGAVAQSLVSVLDLGGTAHVHTH